MPEVVAPSHNGRDTGSSIASQLDNGLLIHGGGPVYPGPSDFSYYGGVYGQYPPTFMQPSGSTSSNSISPAPSMQFFTPSIPYTQPAPGHFTTIYPAQSSGHAISASKRTRPPPRLIAPIPSPTPSYLTPIISHRPTLLPSARPLLIVLDLNGVLIYRRPGSKDRTSFRPRTGIQDFLSYIFANHHVMIWTSTKQHNATSILSRLLTPEQNQALVGVWCREQCGLPARHFDSRVQIHKHLSWIWKDHALSQRHGFGPENTLLVDDSVLKAAAEPHNLVHVPEWNGEVEEEQVLRRAREMVKRAAWVGHVGRYMYWSREGDGMEEVERELDALIAEKGSETGFEGGVPIVINGETDDAELVRSMRSLGIEGEDHVVKKGRKIKRKKNKVNTTQADAEPESTNTS